MSLKTVAIIDNGGANIASLAFALDRLNVTSEITADARTIRAASHVILPGVGAAADAMDRFRRQGLIDVIRTLSQPVLGICLGMQLLAVASDEGSVDCLGLIPGTAKKMKVGLTFPVPHIGWSRVSYSGDHELLAGIVDGSYFYFLHSYALMVADCTLATANHSNEFTAIAAYKNFVATQFHPEKSSTAGARLLANFLKL
ncbi:MAG: imidazole glycerol phosphate synthase subunit HisH [Proteobacteria bacterium]|nr:imidazole glycerol phosphate synthase subunit HisH [Pseudomonadota bacterium]